MKRLSNLVAIVAVTTLMLSTAVQARDRGGAEGWYGGRWHYDETASPQRFDKRVDRRQAKQAARIRNAIDDGNVTRREAKRLREDQRRIARMERRFESDGYYSAKERRIMEKALDRPSRRIQRAKYNDLHPRHGRHHGLGRHHNHEPADYGYLIEDNYLPTRIDDRSFALQTDAFSISWSKSKQE